MGGNFGHVSICLERHENELTTPRGICVVMNDETIYIFFVECAVRADLLDPSVLLVERTIMPLVFTIVAQRSHVLRC